MSGSAAPLAPQTEKFRTPTLSLGKAGPDLTQALRLASDLEDAAIVEKEQAEADG